ncbi:MAG TPA: tetratricopeptide repeat protein, partial [Cytophagaceae bacterium]|nr:tetratricopeptide repeat protein [Cytophagaceae bacterium]
MKRRFLVFCLTLITLASFYSGAFSRIDPKAKNYYHKGLESFKKTNYAEALINFSSAISLYPQYEMAFLNRAYTQEKLGNSFQAIADYSEVIKINAKNKDAYYHRGHLNSRIGLDDEAIKDYTKTIGLDGKNYKAYYERGFIYNIMGLYQEALKDFEKCSQLKHGAEIDYITGIIESKLGNEEKAIVFFTNALKIDKNNI